MTQHNRNFLEEWAIYLSQQGKSEHTILAYRQNLRHFIRWHESAYQMAFDPEKVMPRDIRDWKSDQQNSGKAAPASINQRLAAISQFFIWAKKQGICRDNPAEDVGLIRINKMKPQALKTAQLRRLLRAAYDDKRDYAMIELLAGTGLRVGELLALKCGDLTINDRSGRVIVRKSKHGQSRDIPLTLDVRKALLTYIEDYQIPMEYAEKYFWIARGGQPLQARSSVMRMLRKYGDQVGIAQLHPHILRHTFATRYLKANSDDLRGLARLLGHSNLNTVMLYTEPDWEDLTDRMERMELG